MNVTSEVSVRPQYCLQRKGKNLSIYETSSLILIRENKFTIYQVSRIELDIWLRGGQIKNKLKYVIKVYLQNILGGFGISSSSSFQRLLESFLCLEKK
jgi:hypothetical protein